MRAFEALGAPIYVYDFATQRICWSNESARSFWNASSQEELHSRDVGPFSPANRIRMAEYREAFARGEHRLETWTYYPKGVATTATARCSGVRIEGCPEGMLVEIRALSWFELPVSELRAIEALRHTPLQISMFSANGTLLMRNPAGNACFGALDRALERAKEAAPDRAGGGAGDRPGDRPRERADNHFRAMFAEPGDYEDLVAAARLEGRSIRRARMAIDGSPVHAVQLQIVTDPATGEPGFLVAQQDVSELSSLADALAASKEAFSSLLAISASPAVILDARDGAVLEVNFAARSRFGDLRAGAFTSADLFVSLDGYAVFRGEVLTQGLATGEMRMRSADGTIFWALLSGAKITHEDREALVIFISDVDALHRNAARLEAALDTERELNGLQRRFLDVTSHEFRTPLAVIDGAAQRLARNADTLAPAAMREMAQRIRGTVKRLLHLIDNTLGRVRNNDIWLNYSPEIQRIDTIIRQSVSAICEVYPQLFVDAMMPELPEVACDRILIEQLITNIVMNAIKYSDENPRVEIRAGVNDAEIWVRVRDRGIGIPPEERARIFEDYQRGSNVENRAGTGLGLAIARQIVELHGGRIAVVDTIGKGTTFEIVLPRYPKDR